MHNRKKGVNIMVSKTVQVVNEQGMHMRPAGLLVAEMKKFPNCVVMLNTNRKECKGNGCYADNGRQESNAVQR